METKQMIRFTTSDQQAWLKNQFFLTKAQRAQLIEEFIECSYEVDEDYGEDAEITDREWLSRLGNVDFCNAITDLMPEALLYL